MSVFDAQPRRPEPIERYLHEGCLAGAQVGLAGEPLRTVEQARATLAQWRPAAAQANLGEAFAMACEIGGPASRVLVLTDHAPPWPIERGQVQWWAFGSPVGNAAFTAAARTRMEDRQRLLLEVADFSGSPRAVQLKLEGAGLVAERTIELDAGQRGQVVLQLAGESSTLRAELGADPLDIDNQVLLLAPADRPLRVSVQLPAGPLRQAVTKALEATGRVVLSPERAELVISDQPPAPDQQAWHVQIASAGKAEAYAGAFVIDRNHPLAEGLSLAGVIWSRGQDSSPEGTPIVTAGNTVLLAVREGPAGSQHLSMAIDMATSNLQDSPDWPILMTNLVGWRLSLLGLAERNVRLGSRVRLALPQEVGEVEWTAPDRPAARLPVFQGRAEVPPDALGLHTVGSSGGAFEFACNALLSQESDLSSCRTGRWGSWSDSPLHRDSLADLAWAAGLAALAVLAAHLAIISRAGGGKGL